MIFAGPQAQFDERPGIRNRLALPAVVRLITAHRRFTLLVPCAARFPAEIMLADQRFLDGLCALRVNLLLAPRFTRLLPAQRFL